MKADLHFHPSFFSRGDKPHITEKTTPSLVDIRVKALYTGMDLIAITSCSNSEHIDKRWEAYMQEAEKCIMYFGGKKLDSQVLILGNIPSSMTYLIHGQEFKTNKGDINVLFAEQRIPIENSNGGFYWLLDSARNCGENTLIGINQLSKCKLTPKELRELYEKGKIDFLESYNSMDFEKNNQYAKKVSDEKQIPGIAVSDGHRLEDMARAYIRAGEGYLPDATYAELAKYVKNAIKSRSFENIQEKTPLKGKALYLARLANAMFFPKL